jgi:hypothetical protein
VCGELARKPLIIHNQGSEISGVRLKDTILAAVAVALRGVISFAMFGS